MDDKKVFYVNKKVVFVFVGVQIFILALLIFALLAPKTVTVHVEKVDAAYQIERPLEIVIPNLSR